MKKVLMLLLGASLALPALRASSVDINALRIHCKSGVDVTILLEDSPVVRFDDLNLVISTDNNVVSISSEDARKITYVNVNPDGINSTEMSEALFCFGKESLNIKNLTPDTSVSIYTVDGHLVSSAVTDADGNATLTIPGHSASFYIIKTPTVSFKLRMP